jgi:hypothetical protein
MLKGKMLPAAVQSSLKLELGLKTGHGQYHTLSYIQIKEIKNAS